jgi:hypothetical protein
VSRITAPGCITAGKLWLDDGETFDRKVLRWEGEAVVVELRKVGKRQTDEKRGYYWSEIVPAFAEYMREMGDTEATDQDAHDALSFKFNPLPPTPLGTPRKRSTSPDEMSDEEFSEYLTKCIAFGRVECHIDIREPIKDPALRQRRQRRVR